MQATTYIPAYIYMLQQMIFLALAPTDTWFLASLYHPSPNTCDLESFPTTHVHMDIHNQSLPISRRISIPQHIGPASPIL